MTYLEAALTVLKASGKPMTTAEITDAALAKRLISPRGHTPDATMSAALYTYVRDAKSPQVVREFRRGPTRAARDSVRWRLAGNRIRR